MGKQDIKRLHAKRLCIKSKKIRINGNQVIDNNTLTALTLLIAESNPKEKDIIIDLVLNFLNNE